MLSSSRKLHRCMRIKSRQVFLSNTKLANRIKNLSNTENPVSSSVSINIVSLALEPKTNSARTKQK